MSDMWLPPEEDPRGAEHPSRGERAILVEYLDHYRATLELKCQDLSPEQLATRSVPPSSMSLLGLVRHLARVEHHWFRREIEGQDVERLFSGPDEDTGFGLPDLVDQALVDEAFALWRGEVEHARTVLDGVTLDRLVALDDGEYEVRDLVVHMIEEYARHCGHADLLRECIDGRTGQ